jgi:hypothetical protein
MLRREQDRIGAELGTTESRQVTLDASLDDWQQVMDLAVQFRRAAPAPTGAEATARGALQHHRASRGRGRQDAAAVPDEVHVRDGHVAEAAYKEPFDLLFLNPSSNTTMWWPLADEMARHLSATRGVTARGRTPRVIRS